MKEIIDKGKLIRYSILLMNPIKKPRKIMRKIKHRKVQNLMIWPLRTLSS